MSNKRIKDLQEGSLSSTTYLPIDSAGGGTRRVATSSFAISDSDATSGNLAEFDANGNPVDSGIPSTSIGDLGNAIGMQNWNQLVSSSTSSVTLTSGHKYITRISGTDSLVTGAGTAVSVTGGTDNVIDITLLFGSGNEPTTVSEFRAMFPLSYYPYYPIGGFHSNPNLIDNPWFTVNQRGATTGTVTTGTPYAVDRWYPYQCTYTVSSNGFQMSTPTGEYSGLFQFLEEHPVSEGDTFTISVKIGNEIYKHTFICPALTENVTANFVPINIVYENLSSNARIHIHLNETVTIRAVKMELGSVSTLHMDTAPNYAEELLKCQRYFWSSSPSSNFSTNTYLLGGANSTSSCGFQLRGLIMRATPSATFSNINIADVSADSSTRVAVTAISCGTTGNVGVLMSCSTSGLTKGNVYQLRLNGGYIWLSADL